MIPQNFVYSCPDTVEEAVLAYKNQSEAGKKVFYYGGGSEIISMARACSIVPQAIIDLKMIPECKELKVDNEKIVIGSAVSLREISGSELFPLLAKTSGRIADHTNQCRITLGGNICGTIIYREAVLPLLLAEAELVLVGPGGPRRVVINNIFDGRLKLVPGEFVVQVYIENLYSSLPYYHVKKSPTEKIDYAAVTMAGISQDQGVKIAFSGIGPFPFRSKEIEAVINDKSLSTAEKVEKIIALLPEKPLADSHYSSEYRKVVFKNMLKNLFQELEQIKKANLTNQAKSASTGANEILLNGNQYSNQAGGLL